VSPPALEPFRHTVAVMVQNNSRHEDSTHDANLTAFGSFMLRNGLTPATALCIARQLLNERWDNGLKWRRASMLDWLQYDVFRHLAKKFNIDFGSFFANSTAHYQHYYWRNMQPGSFHSPPDESDHRSLGGAIQYGYQSMDRLLGRFMVDFPHYLLVLCTALSQEAWADSTKITYRPRDFAELLRFTGISPHTVEVQPIMAEEFIIRFANEEAVWQGMQRFGRLSVDGRPLMEFKREGNALVGGCAVNETGALEWPIGGGQDGSERALKDLFHQVNGVRSGRHSPEGVLWCRTGEHGIKPDPVDLIDIAPTILDRLGVPQPDYMTGHPLALPVMV
ncbi:MAG: hypothetical protein M3313_02785, partial [Actinomycetota bacterium]|nr:hypothetical protein [Actinomycetota bacterium]